MFIVPTPPPYAGPEILYQAILKSPLTEEFEIFHLRCNIHRTNAQRGTITVFSVLKYLGLLGQMFLILTIRRPYCVYTILNQNFSGFMRDSLLVIISKIFRRKVILHFHGSNFEYFYKTRGTLFKKYILFILNLSDKVILQAQRVKERFKKFVPEKKLCLIYNAVPEHFIGAQRGPKGQGEKRGIHVLFLNHLSVAKGFLDLLEAAKRILGEREDIHFIIAGDIINKEKNILFSENGQQIIFKDIPDAIETLRQNKNSNGNIRFLGEVSEINEKLRLFRSADIFVLPSYSEGCPMSVLEAMAVGLPLVVTPVGALVDIIKERENGVFVAIGQPEDLKNKIVALADNPSLCRTIGHNNQLLVQSRFNISILSQQLSSVFNELALN